MGEFEEEGNCDDSVEETMHLQLFLGREAYSTDT